MRELPEFLSAVVKHWVVLVMGGLPFAVLGIWERYFEKQVAWSVAFGLFAAATLVATFLAWKEKRDALAALCDRQKFADSIQQLLVEANYWWDTGCKITPDEAVADKWCSDYDTWIVGFKTRAEMALGSAEVTSIFQIGPGLLGVRHQIGRTNEHGHRMACLKLHMEELMAALRRYLPHSA